MHRIVNGVRVPLTPEEIVERQKEEEAFLAERDAHELEFGHVEPRKAEYPPIGDQLEIILKQLAMFPGKTMEFQELLDNIQAIKDKYPKQI